MTKTFAASSPPSPSPSPRPPRGGAGRADHPPRQAGRRDLQPLEAHPLKCTTCHKDDKGGAIEGFNKTVNKDTAHAKCQECHKKEGKGPQKCADCHKKA